MKLMERFDAWLRSRHMRRQWEEEERAFANHWLKFAPYYEYELDPWPYNHGSLTFSKSYLFGSYEPIGHFSDIQLAAHSGTVIPWNDGMTIIPRVEMLW